LRMHSKSLACISRSASAGIPLECEPDATIKGEDGDKPADALRHRSGSQRRPATHS
jgi:hypothetical protein